MDKYAWKSSFTPYLQVTIKCSSSLLELPLLASRKLYQHAITLVSVCECDLNPNLFIISINLFIITLFFSNSNQEPAWWVLPQWTLGDRFLSCRTHCQHRAVLPEGNRRGKDRRDNHWPWPYNWASGDRGESQFQSEAQHCVHLYVFSSWSTSVFSLELNMNSICIGFEFESLHCAFRNKTRTNHLYKLVMRSTYKQKRSF